MKTTPFCRWIPAIGCWPLVAGTRRRTTAAKRLLLLAVTVWVACQLTGCEIEDSEETPMMPMAGEIVEPESPKYDNLPLRRIVGLPLGADLTNENNDPTKPVLTVRVNANYGLNDYQMLVAKTKPAAKEKTVLMTGEMYVANEMGDGDNEQITIEATIRPATAKEAKDNPSREIYTLYSVTANGRTISFK